MLLNDNRIQNSADEYGGFRVVTIPRDIRESIFNNEASEEYTVLLDTVFRRE